MSLSVRPVAADDYEAWSTLWTDYLSFYKTERPAEVHRLTFDRILSPDESLFSALAWQGDRPVGLVNWLFHRTFWDAEDRCYLNDLFVHPDARGARVAEKLIIAVKEHATRHNCAQVYWLTAQDNASAPPRCSTVPGRRTLPVRLRSASRRTYRCCTCRAATRAKRTTRRTSTGSAVSD